MDSDLGRDNNVGRARPGTGVHRLFLSHAGIDREAALRLARQLEGSEDAKVHGLKVWIDADDLGAGGRWKDALQSALDDSTAFAVYVGNRGVVNWVWSEVSVALDRAHKDPNYRIIPILATGTKPTDLPSFLFQYQGVGDPSLPEEFQKLLRGALRLDARAEIALERHPFIGLQSYTSNQVHLFFGREKETEELIALLQKTAFVLVTGDSGAGKSSLVLAGLVPAFRGGRLGRPTDAGPDQTIWHVIETRPGNDPFKHLADSVRAAAEQSGMRPLVASELADLIRTRQPDKVRDAVLAGAPIDPAARPTKILIIVDQFEEFRTSPDAASYATTLLHLAAPDDDRIRVVLTMRRDYQYICDSFENLRERLQSGGTAVRYMLRRMSPDGLRAAITKPLTVAGIDEADRDDLARAVLKDVGDEPGELALLQVALWRTWSEANGRGPNLVRAYDRIGRVEGALAQAAEKVFGDLSPEEQQRAETLFVRLVRPGEAGGATRRVARLEEFDEPTRALADRLAQEKQWRLLTIHEDTVEIAHEQLASQWLRYQLWISNIPADAQRGVSSDPRGDDLRLLQSLIADAARWQGAPPAEKADYLASGIDLGLYAQLCARRRGWISKGEIVFINASNAVERERKTKTWRVQAAMYALLVCIILGLVAWIEQRRLSQFGRWVFVIRPYMAEVQRYALTDAEERAKTPFDTFRECPKTKNCPEMVVLPAGKFKMGEPGSFQHDVTISRPFAVGKYDVTYDDWDACVIHGDCNAVVDMWGRGRQPVVNVTLANAEHYVAWLSKVTGKRYRLLTETEWEYAARAESETAYSFGPDAAMLGDYAWYVANSNSHAHPVGEKKPNKFGLYDMHGNVYQWVEDCWHSSMEGGPNDQSAWVTDCRESTNHVVRGGSWLTSATVQRSAYRGKAVSIGQNNELGFRVARDLLPR
jgi:formylglycine-generating enzyme required for sulfatase activity/energy-coupling factor transporter ATP-binding protein EcfA2